jgi:hypothetical protein
MSTEQQAFPVVVDGYLHEGITVQDYFAAKAMQALVSKSEINNGAVISQIAYSIAFEMMRARGETK